MCDLVKNLNEMESTKEELIRDGYIKVACLEEECNDIINGKLSFEDSCLMREIRNAELDENKKSIGFGIYWSACTKRFREIYLEMEASTEKEQLFENMSALTVSSCGRFDFTKDQYVPYKR